MSNPTPIQRVSKSLSGLLAVMVDGRDAEYYRVSAAYQTLSAAFNSPEFMRYRESFGRVTGMAENLAPGTDTFFKNFKEALQYWDEVSYSILNRKIVPFHAVSFLYTRINIMEMHGEDMDAIFAAQS
ncbi:MAG TPA: hypothetical protein VJJ21_03495 [Candidatus Nanoarchaeia archaeon]|nr:hypothetical protein [Candidatus Nanoarchaeia archaeon]